MDLRPIPFLNDTTYKLDNAGCLFRTKGSTPKHVPSMTRVEATKKARTYGKCRLELVHASSIVRILHYEDGRREDIVEPYIAAQYVTHVGGLPVEVTTFDPLTGGVLSRITLPKRPSNTTEPDPWQMVSGCEWQGGEVPLVGDPESGWFCVCTEDGNRVHIFHGPSTSAEIFTCTD